MVHEGDIVTAERLTRLETKLDILIAQIDKLPPSPTCVANHKDHETRLTKLEGWRNKIIGIMLALNIVFILVIDKIKNWMWPT
jgi:hypothetical protein